MTAVLAVAVAASLLLPKKYKAEAAVVVDERGIDPLSHNGAMPTQLATSYVATQVDVIASHNVALKVVDRMKLTTDREIVAKFQEKTGGIGSIRDWAADEILKSLTVKPVARKRCNLPGVLEQVSASGGRHRELVRRKLHTGQS